MSNHVRFEWGRIRADLTAALSIVGPPLEDGGFGLHVESIREYVDVGEYGLALDELCSLLKRSQLQVPQEAYDLLQAVGSTMRGNGGDLDPATWEALKAQVVSQPGRGAG